MTKRNISNPRHQGDPPPPCAQQAWLVDTDTGEAVPTDRHRAQLKCTRRNMGCNHTRWRVAVTHEDLQRIIRGAQR